MRLTAWAAGLIIPVEQNVTHVAAHWEGSYPKGQNDRRNHGSAMTDKPGVVLNRFHHRGEDCIAIRFAKDFGLNSEVRKIPGSRFSATNACWYVVDGNGVLNTILEKLEGKAQVDHSSLTGKESQVAKRACPPEYIEQLERMRYSDNTQKIYKNFFVQFINHFPDSAVDEISDEDVNRYMKYLLSAKKVSLSTQNQGINAIKFYYEKVRNRERKVYALERPLKEAKLPKVLSQAEVVAILGSADNLKHRTMLWLIYAAGLRRSELINLKANDIDSGRMVINIRGGKGKKDRITLLSEKILALLREYSEHTSRRAGNLRGWRGNPIQHPAYRRYFQGHCRSRECARMQVCIH